MTTLSGPEGMTIRVEPYGPSARQVDALLGQVAASDPVASLVDGSQWRWLWFRADDQRDGKGHLGIPEQPRAFTAVLYDYTRERAVEVAGDLGDPIARSAVVRDGQPTSTAAEFADAVAMLRRNAVYGPALRSGALRAYRPMPPVLAVPGADGQARRAVGVGLHVPRARRGGLADPLPQPLDGALHRIVTMVMATGELYTEGLEQPPHGADCGAPLEDTDCPDTGSSGQAVLTTHDGDGVELWRLLVVRPAASSGTSGSGVELRHVSFRGQSVLERAHVPILNVRYLASTACGPAYRDWLNEETCFEADGEDVGSGFRLCDNPPRTILDTGSDGGSFRGVAVHFDGPDLVLTSELAAGWYRYTTDWRLRPDGAIEPRVGFSAVANPCTCQSHVHHAYWRFDWAINGRDGHRVEEHNDPPLDGHPEGVHTVERETSRTRDSSRGRHWTVSDIDSGAGYRIVPGPNDGTADVYGAGDTWFLRYKSDEIDDGQGFSSDIARSRARLDLFADAELLDGEDIVVWYAGHFLHTSKEAGQRLGPDLVPFTA